VSYEAKVYGGGNETTGEFQPAALTVSLSACGLAVRAACFKMRGRKKEGLSLVKKRRRKTKVGRGKMFRSANLPNGFQDAQGGFPETSCRRTAHGSVKV